MSRKRTAIEEFDADRVRPLPNQPRKRFRGIKELADSIAEIGQQQAGIVTLVDDDPKFDAQLIDGERRLRACRQAGVPFRAEIASAADAETIFAESFAANFGKQSHDAIEIAEALWRMQAAGKSAEQLSRIAGKGINWVYQHLNLLKLHPDVQKMMIPGESDEDYRLTFSLAQLLVPLNEADQLRLARRIMDGDGMGIAAARRMILKERSRKGDKAAYVNKTGKARSIQTIESILEDCSNRIGVYLDMPPAQLNALIDAVDNADKAALIEVIDEFTDNVSGLAEAIQARLDAARAKASLVKR